MLLRSGRHTDPAASIEGAVLGARGRSPVRLRRAAFLHGRRAAAEDTPAPPDELRDAATLIDTVARHAYRVTDEDVEALRSAGWSDHELFDLVVAAALGAGLERRSLGRAAVDAWEQR